MHTRMYACVHACISVCIPECIHMCQVYNIDRNVFNLGYIELVRRRHSTTVVTPWLSTSQFLSDSCFSGVSYVMGSNSYLFSDFFSIKTKSCSFGTSYTHTYKHSHTHWHTWFTHTEFDLFLVLHLLSLARTIVPSPPPVLSNPLLKILFLLLFLFPCVNSPSTNPLFA